MDYLHELKRLNPQISRIDEIPIGTESDLYGWKSFLYNEQGVSIAGGTADRREKARRVCVAEAFERALFEKIAGDPLSRKEFLIDSFPTSSGFAAGFEHKSTQLRAVCEGLERWIWSKWIDDQYFIDEVKEKEVILSSLGAFLKRNFKSCKYYSRKFSLILNQKQVSLKIGIIVGLSDAGAFAGSRVCDLAEDPWEHAMIEAARNRGNDIYFKIHGFSTYQADNIIAVRANYFANNRASAIKQIEKAHDKNWPSPEILLLKDFDTGVEKLFLTRCLFKEFVGWHLGDEKRFVY